MRTLLDRKDNIVTEEEDKREEDSKIKKKKTLNQCGHPDWAIKKDSDTNKSKGMVVIPYVQGVSEPLQRVFKKHNIHTAMKPAERPTGSSKRQEG